MLRALPSATPTPLCCAVMPHGGLVDYAPCVLASIPPGGSLLQVFRSQGRYVPPEQLFGELEAEGPAARRARWAHVPQAIQQRQPPWLV